MNIKPSLQTRTRFNDYIENISFGHLRHDFAQVNIRQATSTIWAIIQLSARFSFITGFGGPGDREEVTPLAVLVSSLGEDAEGTEPSSATGAYRMCTPWEQLLHETLDEIDLCVRGGQVGSDYHLHLLDQAMEELITASAAECPSSHQRFYDYFLRDIFGSYHARYVWLKAQRVDIITSRSTPAKGMPSDSLKLPQWITENVMFELDESRRIDFRVLDGKFQQEHWNDLGLFEKIACLVRDSLSDPLVDKPFDKLVGTLDQFFSLFLAQRMVASEAEIRGLSKQPQAEGVPLTGASAEQPAKLSDLLKLRGTMEGEGDHPLPANPPVHGAYDWLTAFEDQEMVRPRSLTPKDTHAAEQANLQAVMRNLMRGFTRNGRLGADALEPNAFISQTVKIFLGPTPATLTEQFERSMIHEPTLLRTSEPSDPAAKQLLSVEEQRKANREAEVTELLYGVMGDPEEPGFQEKFASLREQVLAEAVLKGVTARRGLSDLVDRAVALHGTGFNKPRPLTVSEITTLTPVINPCGHIHWGNKEHVVYGLAPGKEWMIGSDLYSAGGEPVDLNGAIPGKRAEDGSVSNFGGTLESLMGEWLHEQVVFALPGLTMRTPMSLFQLPEVDPVAHYTSKGRELSESGKLEGGVLHFTGATADLGGVKHHLFTPSGREVYVLGHELCGTESSPIDLLHCVVPAGIHAYNKVTEKMFGKVLVPGDYIGIPHDMVDNHFVLHLDTYIRPGVTRNELFAHVIQHNLSNHASLETVGSLVEGIIKNVGGLDKDRAVIIAEAERLIKVLHDDYVANDMPATMGVLAGACADIRDCSLDEQEGSIGAWLRMFVRNSYMSRELDIQRQDDLFHHLYLHKGTSTILNVNEQDFVEKTALWMDLRRLPYPESADAYVADKGSKMLAAAAEQLEEGRIFRPEHGTTYEYVPVLTRRGQDDLVVDGITYDLYNLRDDSEYILFEPIFDRLGRALRPEKCNVAVKGDNDAWVILSKGAAAHRYPAKVNGLHKDDRLAVVGRHAGETTGDLGDMEDHCLLYVKRAVVKKEQ